MSNELAFKVIYKIAHEAKVYVAIFSNSAASLYEQLKSLTNKPRFDSLLYIYVMHMCKLVVLVNFVVYSSSFLEL